MTFTKESIILEFKLSIENKVQTINAFLGYPTALTYKPKCSSFPSPAVTLSSKSTSGDTIESSHTHVDLDLNLNISGLTNIQVYWEQRKTN